MWLALVGALRACVCASGPFDGNGKARMDVMHYSTVFGPGFGWLSSQ